MLRARWWWTVDEGGGHDIIDGGTGMITRSGLLVLWSPSLLPLTKFNNDDLERSPSFSGGGALRGIRDAKRISTQSTKGFVVHARSLAAQRLTDPENAAVREPGRPMRASGGREARRDHHYLRYL